VHRQRFNAPRRDLQRLAFGAGGACRWRPAGMTPATPDASEARVTRCHGVSRAGVQCRWTAASEAPEAAPLRGGSLYCAWHLPQHLRLASSGKQDGLRQLCLDKFFATPQRRRSDVQLTQEQKDLIAANRQKALERRQRKQSEHLLATDVPATFDPCAASQEIPATSVSSALVAPSQESAPLAPDARPQAAATMTLTKEQLERIASNRQRALERRASRLQEAEEQALLSQKQQQPQQQQQQQDSMPVIGGDRSDGPKEDTTEAQQEETSLPRAQSRTPPRKRRRLTVSLTASPVLLPARRSLFGGSAGAAAAAPEKSGST